MKQKPDAILFDWDGTLVDTLPGLLIAHNHVRGHFDLQPWTTEQFHKEMKFSSRELYPKIYGERVEEAFDVLRRFMHENILNYLVPIADSERLLQSIHKTGTPIGIVSNKRHEFLVREIEHLGWGQYISVQAGAGYAAQDKPSGEPIRKALSEIGIKPENTHVWYVGDTETDMLAARDSACAAVLLLHGAQRPELVETYSPAYVFNNLQEVLDCLKL